jgi:hypothetical protein
MKHFKDVFVLTRDEYEDLTNPDTTYTLMTKTAAKKAVTNILKHFDVTCWNDAKIHPDDWCCAELCPVYNVLGWDAGERLCTRQKTFSK